MRSTELVVPVENTVRALRRLAPGARLRRPGTPELRVIAAALRDCTPSELAEVHPEPVARAVLAAQLRALDRAMTGFFAAGGPESARLVRAARFGRVRRGRRLRDRLDTEPGLRMAALAWAEVLGHRILAGELRGVQEIPGEEDGRRAAELAVAALLPRAERETGGREVLLPWPDGNAAAPVGGPVGSPAGGDCGSAVGGPVSSPSGGDCGPAEDGPLPAGGPVGSPPGAGGGPGRPSLPLGGDCGSEEGEGPRAGAGEAAGSEPGDGGGGGWSGLPPRAGGSEAGGSGLGAGGGWSGGGEAAGSGPGDGGGGGSGLPPRAGGSEAGGSGPGAGGAGSGQPPRPGAGEAGAGGRPGLPSGAGGDSPSRAGGPGGSAFLHVRSVRVTDHGFQVDVHADPPAELLCDDDGLTLRALRWNGLGRVVDDLGYEYLLLARDHSGTGTVRHWCHPRPAPGARVLRLESAGYRGERVRLEPAAAGTCAEVLVKLELTVRLGA